MDTMLNAFTSVTNVFSKTVYLNISIYSKFNCILFFLKTEYLGNMLIYVLHYLRLICNYYIFLPFYRV